VTLRERILTVYQGGTPDAVPYMLDLSHWFYHRHRLPWDLSAAYEKPERELIAYHREVGAGFYVPNLGSFYAASFPADVTAETEKHIVKGVPEITWRLRTPLGTIERRRLWNDRTYAWGISRWGIRDADGLRVFAQAMSRRTFRPKWENYLAWVREVGDVGIVCLSPGYSAMGHLLHYWMGVEGVAFAAADFPEVLQDTVEAVNANTLDLIDLLAVSPAEVILMGDNFSSDVQPPHFFARWSKPFYDEAVRRLHRAGKKVAVHIDGRLRGAIRMIRETGTDCGDAITPVPMGDLTAAQCRDEVGPEFILSGGISPDLWLPGAPIERFRKACLDWLELRHRSSRLIAAAGDQVPPGAEEDRIAIARDLVDAHGRY
jgi:hypothetical protein